MSGTIIVCPCLYIGGIFSRFEGGRRWGGGRRIEGKIGTLERVGCLSAVGWEADFKEIGLVIGF